VPYIFGLHVADVFQAKPDKSKAFLHIVNDIDDSDLSVNPRDCMIIEDGNPLFHGLQEIPLPLGT